MKEAKKLTVIVATIFDDEHLFPALRAISIADISLVMNILRHTVSDHVKNIYRKLNISSRAEATLRAKRLGLV